MRLKRIDVLDLLKTKLGTILIVNGYTSNCGQSVSYAEGIEEEPSADCIAVIDGREEFGALQHSMRTIKRVLNVNISFCYVGNNPSARAKAGVEDVLEFINNNLSLGQNNLKLELIAIDIMLDEYERLAELIAEIKITY